MSDHGQPKPSDELRQAAAKRPHLMDHLKKFKQITGEFPTFIEEASEEYESHRPNVLYPVGGPIFCHIYGDLGQDMKYYAIEPDLDQDERVVFEKVRNKLLEKSVAKPAPQSDSDYDDRIEELLKSTTNVRDSEGDDGVLSRIADVGSVGKIAVDESTYENILYRLNRDIVGLGPLEPVMRDPANEDIHVIGRNECHVDHSVYGMLGSRGPSPTMSRLSR